MNIPRFTAEASLSKSNEHYHLIAPETPYVNRQEVIPQIRIISRGCIYECDWFRRCRLIGCYA